MIQKSGFHRLALAACPWLALTVSPVSAQEPTLADPPRQSDLGYLLGGSAANKQEGARLRLDATSRAEQESAGDELIQPVPMDDATAGEDVTAGDNAEVESRVTDHQPVIQGAAPELEEGTGELGPRVEIIRERYANRKIRIEREVTQDALGNYLNHGSWKMWDERGNLMSEGRNSEGLRQGIWNRWHQRTDSKLFGQYPYSQFTAPFISQADFKDGLLSGTWTIYDAKQRKVSQWNFLNGQQHGLFTWWHPNGKALREMTYKDGAIDGEVVEYSDAGQPVKRAMFQKGRQLAIRTDHYKNGSKKTQGMYLHAPLVVKTPDDWWNAIPAVFTAVGQDERHGEWSAWFENGQEQIRGSYKNDKEDGTFTWWFENGQKSAEGEYFDGQQQGTWVWWHKNGQKSTEGNYRQGEQIGRWTMWNELGRVTQASEHDGTEHKTLDANNPVADAPKLESAQTLTTPAPADAPVDTARAPRLLTPGKRTSR